MKIVASAKHRTCSMPCHSLASVIPAAAPSMAGALRETSSHPAVFARTNLTVIPSIARDKLAWNTARLPRIPRRPEQREGSREAKRKRIGQRLTREPCVLIRNRVEQLSDMALRAKGRPLAAAARVCPAKMPSATDTSILGSLSDDPKSVSVPWQDTLHVSLSLALLGMT